MGYCETCHNEITEAKFLLLGNEVYKSCPGCSKNAGEHVFYKCPDFFGRTAKRITSNNPMGLQSHCGRCRANNVGPYSDGILCSDAIKKGGTIISEIRFLPMSIDVFGTYRDARDFLLYDMPDRGNTYYYMKSKMKCEKNALVFFQCTGILIGYAIFEDVVELKEPIKEGGFEYHGYYKFRKNSTRVFKKAITAEQIKNIDVEFKGFNQSHQKKSVAMLPAIMELVTTGKGTVNVQDYVVTIPEEIDASDVGDLKEGHVKQIVVNAYERNPQARRKCIEHYSKLFGGKIKCAICGFSFGDVYGKDFEEKIHVHHLQEISSIGQEYVVDVTKDLIPICPNCHLVAHSQKPALTPEEIVELIKNNSK